MDTNEISERRERLLALIQSKSTGNTAQLANRLGVSERTVNRDISALKKKYPIRWDGVRNSFVIDGDQKQP